MKSKIADKERLLHILDAIGHIKQFTENTDKQTFDNDFKLRLAVVKLFEVIGEAASSISNETQNLFPEIEWPILKGIRNILVHEYFGIDYDIIWNTIQNNLPQLKEKIVSAIDNI